MKTTTMMMMMMKMILGDILIHSIVHHPKTSTWNPFAEQSQSLQYMITIKCVWLSSNVCCFDVHFYIDTFVEESSCSINLNSWRSVLSAILIYNFACKFIPVLVFLGDENKERKKPETKKGRASVLNNGRINYFKKYNRRKIWYWNVIVLWK